MALEHSESGKRGFAASFTNAGAPTGAALGTFILGTFSAALPQEQFLAWGWRVPFLLSLILLGISLWMRLKLSESPVFVAMKAAGETEGNPFVKSFTYPGNKRRIFVALFGVLDVVMGELDR